VCIGSCDLSTERHYPGTITLFCTPLLQYLKGNPPTYFLLTFRTSTVNIMTKMAIVKKATKTTPASNRANPALAPDNPRPRMPTRSGTDVAQSTPLHTEKIPVGSTPAAATKPRTQGDSRTSRTVPPASTRALSSRTGAPSPSSRRSQSSSQRNRARDPNPLRSDSAATHPSPFDFLPRRTGNEASAAARAAQWPIASGDQGGTSQAHQMGSSHHDHRDHISTGRDDAAALPSRRSSPSESR